MVDDFLDGKITKCWRSKARNLVRYASNTSAQIDMCPFALCSTLPDPSCHRRAGSHLNRRAVRLHFFTRLTSLTDMRKNMPQLPFCSHHCRGQTLELLKKGAGRGCCPTLESETNRNSWNYRTEYIFFLGLDLLKTSILFINTYGMDEWVYINQYNMLCAYVIIYHHIS